MMNDCWPAASGWSIIDYYNNPKNAFYSFKRCAKPLLASIDCENGIYRVYVINEGERRELELSVRALSSDRRTVREIVKKRLIVEKDACDIVYETSGALDNGEILICNVVCENASDRAFYAHGALNIRPVETNVKVDRERGLITVSAKEEYVHAVVVSGNVVLDDNCFSLLPGESRTVAYRLSQTDLPDEIFVEAYTVK